MEELVTPPEQDVESAPEEAAERAVTAVPDVESAPEEAAERAVTAAPDAKAAPEEAAEQAVGAPDAESAPEEAGIPGTIAAQERRQDADVAGRRPDPPEAVSMEELMGSVPEGGQTGSPETAAAVPLEEAQLRAVLEAIIYVAEEPVTPAQLAAALQQPVERVRSVLGQLAAEFEKPEHGIAVREVAGGYKMTTKPEHHETVRSFAKSLKPPLKLSLPALETLAVIAYKQPVTAPEIMEIRGVQGAGVLKTLLDRKLIASAGRKNVIGKPILYKTTKEFLIQFGLKDLSELPSLKEFEEIRRMAFADSEVPAEQPAAEPGAPAAAPEPQSEGPAEPGPEGPDQET